MYPTLSNTDVPAQALRDKVAQGELGMKTGKGFFDWPEDRKRAERARYDTLLRQGLALLASELPTIEPPTDTSQTDTPTTTGARA